MTDYLAPGIHDHYWKYRVTLDLLECRNGVAVAQLLRLRLGGARSA